MGSLEKERPSSVPSIIARLDMQLQKEGREVAHNAHLARFIDVNYPDDLNWADIGVAYDENARDGHVEWFAYTPPDIKYPVYIFYGESSDSDHHLVSSPYGKQERRAIGANNKLYHFDNFYFLNRNGEGVKYEEIFCYSEGNETLDETLRNVGINPNEVKRLDFSPDEKDSRYVEIEPEDYKYMSDVLEKIENGSLVVKYG